MTGGTKPAVELRALTKDFVVGLKDLRLRAVDQLSLRVECGEVFGLLGPNGSGKSTTIKLVLGLLRPSAGESEIFGVSSSRVEARAQVGYLPESPNFQRFLSGRELVAFYGRICGLAGARLKSRVEQVLGWAGLTEAADRRVGTYSKGMLQRVGLAQALVHDPQLVILDEPTAGVDPLGAAAMADLIRQLKAQGKTVVITSHLLAQVEDVCDRVAILDRGRLLLCAEVASLGNRAVASSPESLDENDRAELARWLSARGKSPGAVVAAQSRLDRIFIDEVRKNRSDSGSGSA